MIDKVLPGQRVTAETTNKVIDVCNGLQTPSESFVNTPNGTLTPVPGYQARYTYLPVPETVLQTKYGPSLKMTSRGTTRDDDQWSQDQKEMTWFCFLGPDTAALAQCLPSSKTPDSIWLGNSDPALFAEVTDSMLSSLRPVGYYADLAAYDEDSVAVKEVKLTKSDDQQDPGKNVLVICGESLDDFGKILEDSRYDEYDEAAAVNTIIFAKINGQDKVFQLPLKAAQSQQIDLVGDSQLSAAELSSVVVRELSGKPFIELHEFHEDNTKTINDISADGVDVLIRNPKGPNDGRELQYVSLSSLLLSGTYIPPDADVEDAETSSLQTRELDNGTLVEEMFNFHLSDTVDVRISDLTGVDVVIRNPNDGQPYVQYGKLCIDIAPDAQGQTEQKSLDWLSSTNELQLYKFDKDGLSNAFEPDVTVNGTREYLLPNEYEFVLRKNGAGGEVAYGQVALSVKIEELSGDSQVGEQKSININDGVVELYKMGQAGTQTSAEVPTSFDAPKTILSDDCEFVIRKGGAGGEIDYATVKLRQAVLSVDRQGHPNQRSLQYANLGDGAFLELNEFHANGTTKPVATLSSADTSLLPADNEFLIRRKVNGFWQLEYAPLSAKVELSAVPVDATHTQSQKSIEWAEDANGKYLQLYKMDEEGQDPSLITLKRNGVGYNLLPDDYEFVVRSRQGGHIDYMPVEICSMLSGGGGRPDVDTDGASTRSIEYNDDELALYKFGDSSFITRSVVDFSLSSMEADYYYQKGYHPENSAVDNVGCSQFLARAISQVDGEPQLEYHLLDVKLPQFVGPDGNDYGAPFNLGQKSIELNNYGGCNASELYWQLYNFDEPYASNERAYDATAELSGSTLMSWLAGCHGVHVKAFQNGSEEVQWLEKKTTGGCGRNSLEYSHMYIVPPAFIRSDDDASTASSNNKTLEVVKDGCVDNCYWRLYHWGCDNGTLTVDLDDNTQATELNSRKVLMMSDDGTTLEYHPLHFTYDGSQYALTSDLTVITDDLTEIWDGLDALSGWCAELSAELSGQYWEQGGDSSTNYGSDIGNSSSNMVIDLDGQELAGCWKTSDFTVDYSLNVGCTATVGTLVASDIIGCTGTFASVQTSNFTLGSTSLSEAQLQQLLALI